MKNLVKLVSFAACVFVASNAAAGSALPKLIQLTHKILECNGSSSGECANFDLSVLNPQNRTQLIAEMDQHLADDRKQVADAQAHLKDAIRACDQGAQNSARQDSARLYVYMKGYLSIVLDRLNSNAANLDRSQSSAELLASLDKIRDGFNAIKTTDTKLLGSLQSAILTAAQADVLNLDEALAPETHTYDVSQHWSQLRASVAADETLSQQFFLLRQFTVRLPANEGQLLSELVSSQGCSSYPSNLTVPLNAHNLQVLFGGSTAADSPILFNCEKAGYFGSPSLSVTGAKQVALTYTISSKTVHRDYMDLFGVNQSSGIYSSQEEFTNAMKALGIQD